MSPLISQQVLSILNGVSQQPDKLRAASQMEAQLNVFDSITWGKIKRPPTTHIAKLYSGIWTTPWLHAVNRDAADKYHVVVAGGLCYVYDGITGNQYQVLTPQGTSYLTLNPLGPQNITYIATNFDTFTGTGGTLLASHVSDSGISWATLGVDLLQGAGPGLFCVNTALLETSGGTVPNWLMLGNASANSGHWSGYSYVQGFAPPYNYTASIQVTNLTGLGGAIANLQIGLRNYSPGTGQNVTGYFLYIPGPHNATINCSILRVDVGGTTSLALFNPLSAINWTVGTPNTIAFSIQGSVITAAINGTVMATVIDGTYPASGLGSLVTLTGQDSGAPSAPTFQLDNWNLQYSKSAVAPAPVQDGFRFVTVQDTTFIVNQTVIVEPLFTVSTPVRFPEALITIALADYGTNYYVTLNNVTVGFQSPAPAAPQSRAPLSTDQMAQQLYTQLTALTGTVLAGFQFTLLGQIGTTQGASTIYVTRSDNADFTISANDGLNDAGIVVVKSSVQNIAALPARALNDMVIKVQPDPQNKVDVAYYQYNNLGSPNLGGVWQECAAPGILTTLNNMTMPWALTRSGDVLSGFPADGPIPLPSISYGIPSNTAHPDPNTTNVGSPAPTNVRPVPLHSNGDNLSYWLTTLTGGSTTVTWTFDYDFGNLPTGQYAQITFTDVHAGTTSVLYISGGSSQLNGQIQQTTTSPANSNFTIVLNYSIGSSPPSSQLGTFNLHGFVTDPLGQVPGLGLTIPTAVQLTWNQNWTYAGGVPVNITITGPGLLTYTPSVDVSAITLAAGVATLAFTGYTGTSLGNVTTFTKASGSPGTTTVSYTWNNTEQYHNPSLALAPNSLAGFAFMDLTDGSSGTVASNTATTVTLSSPLTGGITNAFRANDQVAVTSPSGVLFFVLQPINWTPRGAGDDVTNPLPSFTYNPITEIGYTSGRLCLFSGENIVCSGSNDIYNMFRTTVTQLLDSDRIDVAANSDTVSDWHSMVHWAEGVWLFAGNVQAQLPTEPSLSNSTVSIQPLTKYQSQPTLRPLAMDRRIYFTRLRSPNSAAPVTEILRYQRIRFPFQGFIAEPATKAIPTYLAGTPLALVGDPVIEIMVCLTSAVPNQLYPYIYHYSENQEIQMESWSTWQIDQSATILGIDFLDGVMGMIVQRADGVYLEYMDLQMALYEELS